MSAPTVEQSLAYAKQLGPYQSDAMYGHSPNEAMICVLADEVKRLHDEITRLQLELARRMR